MALVVASGVEGLIQRFRNNDTNENDTWTIDREAWRSFQGWTASQRQQVVDAAEYNESIRTLKIGAFDDASVMNDETIDVFAGIVSCLRKVDRVNIYDGNPRTKKAAETMIYDLYEAIAKCSPNVRHLDCSLFPRFCASQKGILELAERFRNLEVLEVKVPERDDDQRPTKDFGLAFAAATAQTLTSLRNVRIHAFDPDPIISTLLFSLPASSSLRTIDLDITFEWDDLAADDLVSAARCFCVSHTSVERVTIRGQDADCIGEDIDITKLFDIGLIRSFSESMTHVEFFECDFESNDHNLVEKAVNALQHVQYLCFGRCQFDCAMDVVKRLPRLTKFSCVSRGFMYEAYEPMTGDDSEEAQFILVSNEDIEDLCLAIEREGSLLNDIELDLISGDESESFPAITRLMGTCKGRLVLNMSAMPWRVGAQIVEGAQRLRPDLKDLRLRFVDCGLKDFMYADLFRSLKFNRTLTHLEVGFDNGDELKTTNRSSKAIGRLIGFNKALRTLSLRDIPHNGATTMLEAIMTALKTKNRSLRALELHGSLPADCVDRARELALEVLEKNDVLSTLKGLDIPKGDPADSLLLQNRYGRIFLKTKKATTPIGIWPTVLGRVSRDQQVGVMYKFLRAKPTLVCGDLVASSGVAGRKRGRSAEEQRIGAQWGRIRNRGGAHRQNQT